MSTLHFCELCNAYILSLEVGLQYSVYLHLPEKERPHQHLMPETHSELVKEISCQTFIPDLADLTVCSLHQCFAIAVCSCNMYVLHSQFCVHHESQTAGSTSESVG